MKFWRLLEQCLGSGEEPSGPGASAAQCGAVSDRSQLIAELPISAAQHKEVASSSQWGEKGEKGMSSQHLEGQTAILCLSLQSHLLVSPLLLVAANSLALMLKVLLPCAVGAGMPEGWQPVHGEVLTAFSGSGDAVGG